MRAGRSPNADPSTGLALAVEIPISGTEQIASPALPTPAVAPMQATLYPVSPPAPNRRRSPPRAASPDPIGDTVTGSATWYCCSPATADRRSSPCPGALGGQYDPPPSARTVTVCADRCVVLPVVDYCGCHWGTSAQKVADLSPEAWAAVTDRARSAGVVTVTIQLGG